MSRLHTRIVTCAVVLLVCSGGCGGSGTVPAPEMPGFGAALHTLPLPGLPAALPTDGVQPWEELDADGYVIPADRTASIYNGDSEFRCGAEYAYSSLVGLTDHDDALLFCSGVILSGEITWAQWRLELGGVQPGAVSADVNPLPMSDGSLSEYYLGLSDYAADDWDWYGPFSDNHVRLSTSANVAAGSDYLSALGNLFICVVACNGATFDVVGVAANALDDADTEAPAAPEGLTAAPIAGGLELAWNDVIAGDLAGYRVYWRDGWFHDATATGTKTLPILQGTTHCLLPVRGTTYVRVSAVDLSGNESELSEHVSAAPLSGEAPALQLTTSAPSGMVNDLIALSATGAEYYDWDLDGDGVFDVTGDGSGAQSLPTGTPGMIRPRVRGTSGGGECVACNGVSVLIQTNSRPLADGYADPTSGPAPLTVTFTGTGEDIDGTIALYAWDFDGDGTYDYSHATEPDPPAHEYTTPGLYNAKFRVEDDLGLSDVDTVAVYVSDPLNVAPSADLAIGTGEDAGDTPHTVNFDAGGSTDSDGSIEEYLWDFDGDGDYDEWSEAATIAYTYIAGGLFNAVVCVVDDGYAQDTASVAIDVNATPVADIQADVTSGDSPLEVTFDAAGSTDSDGTLEDYEWDLDGDGTFNETGPEEDARGLDGAEYTYDSPGLYTAWVRVTDDDGATGTDSVGIITQNAAPVADLAIGTGEEEGNAPHEVNFDASGSTDADGDIVEYAWDFDGDGTYDRVTTGDTTTYTYTSGGQFTAAVRVEDNLGTQDTDTTLIDVNQPPVAGLTADPTYGESPLEVDFDASGSTDSDGTIEDYEWDFDGDGVFNETGDEADAQGEDTASNTYTTPGVYAPAVRVTDDDGATDTEPVSVTANGWSIVTVDNAGSTGSSTSLAVVDGCPAISYGDIINADLKYARATTSSGARASDWTQIITVDSPGELVRVYGTSLAVVDGCPAISYGDYTNYDLKYARATTSTGASATDWIKVIVDSSDFAGDYSSLAVVDGCPAISYRKYSAGGQVKYARATTSTGASASDWTQNVTVDTGTEIKETSLAVVAGCPAISYYDDTNDDLKYARATTSTGASGWTQIVTVDDSGAVGRYCSLAVISGRPAISYCQILDIDDTPDALKFVRATTSTGASASDWAQVITVDSASYVGSHTSLVEFNGMLAISYFDATSADLKYFLGYGPCTLDSLGFVGEYTSVAEVDGGLAISYYDSTNADLKYAIGYF